MHATIIGGSIAGLFTALALRQAGCSVDIYERSSGQLTGRGAGIVTQPELLAIMQQLGLNTSNNFAVHVEKRALIGTDGEIQTAIAFPQAVTAWDAIYAMLRREIDSAQYHAAHELAAIEQTPGQITAHFINGRSAKSDILVGADGIRSSVRAHLAPDIQPQFAGYVGWRCLTDEAMLPPDVRDKFFDLFCFHYPAGGQVLSYPVAGANNDLRPGCRRLNVVWYRPVTDDIALDNMLTDGDGQTHQLGIPPPLIRTKIRDEARTAADQLPEPFRSAIAATDQFFFQPIYDVVSQQLHFGRAVLAGDAAFTARPHVGAGVTKAAADAQCLAQSYQSRGDHLDMALESYGVERHSVGNAIITETQRLGARIGDASRPLTDAQARQNMIDTATLNFLT